MVPYMVFLSLALIPLASAGKVFWDGRPPVSATPATFDDSGKSQYNVDYNKGQNQSWADIISFPRDVLPSLFDNPREHKAFEVSINDQSIFVLPNNYEGGFRRSELMPKPNNGSDEIVQGASTFHFSLQADPRKPLNFSHLYDIVFMETRTWDAHVWSLKAGTPYDGTKVKSPKTLRLHSHKDWSTPAGVGADVLFEVPWNGKSKEWQNFAIRIDFDKSTIEAWYSSGRRPLKQVLKKTKNNASGQGQLHVGVFKHPTGEIEDPVHKGYQPEGIDEGIVYGGVFVEKAGVSVG